MQKNIDKIIKSLSKLYPRAKVTLKHRNPLEMLVATMLSAQCSDKRVNMVTPALFKKYKTAKDFSMANIKELEQDIRSTGFYHSKAKKLMHHICLNYQIFIKKMEHQINFLCLG